MSTPAPLKEKENPDLEEPYVNKKDILLLPEGELTLVTGPRFWQSVRGVSYNMSGKEAKTLIDVTNLLTKHATSAVPLKHLAFFDNRSNHDHKLRFSEGFTSFKEALSRSSTLTELDLGTLYPFDIEEILPALTTNTNLKVIYWPHHGGNFNAKPTSRLSTCFTTLLEHGKLTSFGKVTICGDVDAIPQAFYTLRQTSLQTLHLDYRYLPSASEFKMSAEDKMISVQADKDNLYDTLTSVEVSIDTERRRLKLTDGKDPYESPIPDSTRLMDDENPYEFPISVIQGIVNYQNIINISLDFRAFIRNGSFGDVLNTLASLKLQSLKICQSVTETDTHLWDSLANWSRSLRSLTLDCTTQKNLEGNLIKNLKGLKALNFLIIRAQTVSGDQEIAAKCLKELLTAKDCPPLISVKIIGFLSRFIFQGDREKLLNDSVAQNSNITDFSVVVNKVESHSDREFVLSSQVQEKLRSNRTRQVNWLRLSTLIAFFRVNSSSLQLTVLSPLLSQIQQYAGFETSNTLTSRFYTAANTLTTISKKQCSDMSSNRNVTNSFLPSIAAVTPRSTMTVEASATPVVSPSSPLLHP